MRWVPVTAAAGRWVCRAPLTERAGSGDVSPPLPWGGVPEGMGWDAGSRGARLRGLGSGEREGFAE